MSTPIEDPVAGGCFAIGLDRSSKPFNAGTLNRLAAAHGVGAELPSLHHEDAGHTLQVVAPSPS